MRIEMWPEGAPLVMGKDSEDRPGITPYLWREQRSRCRQ
jgi:hypothetical protein